MMRSKLVLTALTLWLVAAAAQAAAVRSWSVASAEEFARGTLEGTAVDGEGRVVLAPAQENLWGPDRGIVWDVEPDGAGGAFVALSSPTRVLRRAPGTEPETWHATGDETLVAALLPDDRGGVYLGLSPDGRLLHADAPGRTREVADSEALFIWALAAGPDGTIWIGTGLPGRLLRLDAAGELEARFESGDDPVRCITALADGSVVFGTGGRGRVIRVDAAGRPFVLFDAEEAEVVALASAADGSIYALTARGSKQVGAAQAAAVQADATVRVTAAPPAEGNDASNGGDPPAEPPPAPRPPKRFRTPPGGKLYRILPGGDHRELWQATDEVPFGLVRTDDGRLLVATGDRGRVWGVDDDARSSIVVSIASDQASALSLDADGALLVGGTTDARVTRVGPRPAGGGRYVGPVHDAGAVADWGRLRWEAARPPGSAVRAAVRAGNSAEPDETWTDWVPLDGDGDGDGRAGVETDLPPTRWFQARLELKPSRGGASPELRRVELHYQPHNRQPAIDALTVQPAGVVWTRTPTPSSRQRGPLVAADPVTRRTVSELVPTAAAKPVRKLYELGARTISWTATDPDGNALAYRLDIRRDGASVWIPLAVDLDREFFAWDARGLADGLYRVRLVASDAPDNPVGQALEDRRTSALFRIDNTRPSVGDLQVRPGDESIEVEFVARDPGGNVAAAEVAVDAEDWRPLDPLDGVADEERERYRLTVEATEEGAVAEPRTLKVRVTDSAGNMGGDAWSLEGD